MMKKKTFNHMLINKPTLEMKDGVIKKKSEMTGTS